MAAIVDAARRGVSVKDAILYCTTFPCHDCAKHIVAAGIQKVVYVEPYPKSLAPEIYLDSIVVDQPRSKEITEMTSSAGYVSFESFVGIAPRQYMDLFTMGERKTKAGDVVLPNKASAKPLFGKELPPELAVLVKENQEFNRFKGEMSAKIASLINVPQKNPQSDVVQMKKPRCKVVLKPGWLNRQFDEVTKTVDTWPEWMRRAAGVSEQTQEPQPEQPRQETRSRVNEGKPAQASFKL